MGVVRPELFFVEHASVSLHQRVGKIPVEERDEGLDTRCVQVVDELGVELEALSVDRVISPTERDDP
jgi:hypothetical protein